MKCELCGGVARMFCESDQASLCWDCDGKVHGANFIVAKHTRCLLCSVCQSPTLWNASGFRLGPTVSICESCVARKNNSGAGRNGRDFDGDWLREDDENSAESYDVEKEDEEEEEEEEEEAENQLVPWDAATTKQQPPVVVSSSSSVSSGDGGAAVKRTRRDLDLNCFNEESSDSCGPLKKLRSRQGLCLL